MPGYREIAETMAEEIRVGALEGRLPTIDELATRFSVSRVTMQRAVKVLKECGAVVAAPKRGIVTTRLKRPRTHLLGGVFGIPGGWHLHDALIRGMQTEAARHGEMVAVSPGTNGRPELEVKVLQQILEKQKVDGIVFWPTAIDAGISPGVAYLKATGIPFVLVPECDERLYYDCNTVTNHDSSGADAVMTHLLRTGHRAIGFVACRAEAKRPYCCYRYKQYAKALEAAGITPEPMCLVEDLESTSKPFADVSAIFCVTDRVAMAAIKVCLRSGIRVPADLAVVGYDNTPMADELEITSVEQHFDRIGQMAVDLLLQDIEGTLNTKAHLTTESQLIIRTSTQAN